MIGQVVKILGVFFLSTIGWWVLPDSVQSLNLIPVEDPIMPVIKLDGESIEEINCETPQSSQGCYDLTVDYTDTRSTETYELSSIPYSPEIPFSDVSQLGTPLNVGENLFSQAIPFFNFAFFDNTYNKLAIGENGIISFDASQYGQICLRYPEEDIPSIYLTRNSIFAIQQDLLIAQTPGNQVYYKITGAFPARKMIITYVQAPVFYCNPAQTTSVQIVLEELTNKIWVHVQNKSLNCDVNNKSLLGIMNDDGDLGYAPPGRNTSDSPWTATSESWLFKPNGERIPTISWYEGDVGSGTYLGEGESITLCVNEAPNFYVEVSYPNYKDNVGNIVPLILTDEITASLDYPVGEDFSLIVCQDQINLNDFNSAVSVNPPDSFTFTYHTSMADAENDQNAINPIQTITGETTFYVRIERSDNCFDVATLTVNTVLGALLIQPNGTLEICDNVGGGNGEGSEPNFDFSNFNDLLFNDLNEANEIHYYSDAQGNNEIRIANVTSGMQFWFTFSVNYENTSLNCTTNPIGPINIELLPPPGFVNLPNPVEITMCDQKFDFFEEIDFDNQETWEDIFINSGIQVSPANSQINLYYTLSDAIDGVNEIEMIDMNQNSPTYNPNNNSNIYNVYIKITSPDGCVTITNTELVIRFYTVDSADTEFINICLEPNQQATVDLSCFINDYYVNGELTTGMFHHIYTIEDGSISTDINDLVSLTYHATYADAVSGNNPIGTIQTVDGISGTNAQNNFFFVRFTLCEGCESNGEDCYVVKRIKIRVVNPTPLEDTVNICTDESLNSFVDPLSILNSRFLDAPGLFKVSYFLTEQDAIDFNNELTSYNFTSNDILWIRVELDPSEPDVSCISQPTAPCLSIKPILFLVDEVPGLNLTVNQAQENVCNNNATGIATVDLTQYQDDLYNLSNATFTYYTGFYQSTGELGGLIQDPTQFSFQGDDVSAQTTVYVKIEYEDFNCVSIAKINLTVYFYPAIHTQSANLCACLTSSSQYSTFDLTSEINTMYLSEQNTIPLSSLIVSYYTQDSQENLLPISNITNYQSTRSRENIFVEFVNPATQCYSIDTLFLNNLLLPTPIPGEIEVCDTNFNYKRDVLLNQLDEIVMPNNTEGYFFSYFTNLNDAQNNTNPILTTTPVNEADYFYDIPNGINQIFVRVSADADCDNAFDCSEVNAVTLISGENLFNGIVEIESELICDDNPPDLYPFMEGYNDGIVQGINLTDYEDEIQDLVGANLSLMDIKYYATLAEVQNDPYPYGTNVILNPTNYSNEGVNGGSLNSFYVRIETGSEYCPALFKVNLNIVPAPEVYPDNPYYMCPEGAVDLYLNNPNEENLEAYEVIWTMPNGANIDALEVLDVNEVGVYHVQITDPETGCSTPNFEFGVEEINPPVIQQLQVVNENEIFVYATSEFDLPLEYSIDGIHWQSNNNFPDLGPGIYTLYVRFDYNNKLCLGDPKQTIIFNIQNFVTPNGDHYNDYFVLDHLNVFEGGEVNVKIYDRYGKIIFEQSDGEEIRWNGYYEGRVVPTSDYWYVITIPDGRKFRGSLTVKNRNK